MSLPTRLLALLCCLARLRRGLPALLGACLLASAQAGPAIRLDDRVPSVDVWPAVTLLADDSLALTLDGARQRLADFKPPEGPASTLGRRREAIWLHLPLSVGAGDSQWLLDIDYPPLNQADVYLLRDGMLLLQRRLGSAQPFGERPLPSRSHALNLPLEAGHAYEIYLRVRSETSMVLPITLNKPWAYYARESVRQLMHGGTVGVALALLVYSLAHGLSLRNRMFGLYAVMLSSTTLFFLALSGIAQQYLLPEHSGLLAKIGALSLLVAVVAGSHFVDLALAVRQHSPWIHRALMALSTLGGGALLLSLAGLLDFRSTQLIVILIGPLVPLLVLPGAWQGARAGDRAAFYMLLGWGTYLAGALVMALVLTGKAPATFFTLHVFQWGALVEMLAWMQVLSLHVRSVRRQAERTELARQALESLAHSDVLTGLPNRRGLGLALDLALPQARADSTVVIYLLDLDGFKAINDRFGHDIGDGLLVQAGQRLRAQLRRADVVARLGGDEFVIVTSGIAGEAEAQALGRKVLDAFQQPFDVQGQLCRVGLTIGFAMAPQDGRQAADLLKRADAAMYAGKQAGRHCLHRGGASLAMAGA